jgi:hypothetical protein
MGTDIGRVPSHHCDRGGCWDISPHALTVGPVVEDAMTEWAYRPQSGPFSKSGVSVRTPFRRCMRSRRTLRAFGRLRNDQGQRLAVGLDTHPSCLAEQRVGHGMRPGSRSITFLVAVGVFEVARRRRNLPDRSDQISPPIAMSCLARRDARGAVGRARRPRTLASVPDRPDRRDSIRSQPRCRSSKRRIAMRYRPLGT